MEVNLRTAAFWRFNLTALPPMAAFWVRAALVIACIVPMNRHPNKKGVHVRSYK